MTIAIKRVYEPAARADGYRVLVDRLWPRGLKKEDAKIDLWLREAAPSTQLRRWFNHDPARWDAFCRRYRGELHDKADVLAPLNRRARKGRVTLLYSARDEQHNQAVVLSAYLKTPPAARTG
jgi:uncharacterized protein YeaO (DUF488 family)